MDTLPPASIVVDDPRSLGEGAVWCPLNEKLLWVDITRGKLFVYDENSGENVHIDLRQSIGTVVPYKKDQVVCALLKGICVVDLCEKRIVSCLANPESDLFGNRWNDGKCDNQGRFWCGSMGQFCEPEMGALYKFTLKHSPGPGDKEMVATERQLSNVTISNGICWDTEGSMYFIDSALGTIDQFAFDKEKGTISDRRTCIDCRKHNMGHPDGMTMDAEGMLWVAMWEGWCVARWDPRTGALLGKIALPCAQVTSVAFGGKNLDRLYITTASCGLSAETLAKEQPHAGKLFAVDLSATTLRGVRAPLFGQGLTA